MLRQRKLRDRLVAIAVPPIAVSVACAAGLVVVADPGPTRTLAMVGVGAAVLAALWSVATAWSILRSVTTLAITANGLAEAQARAARGELSADEVPSIGYTGPPDELGRLAEAVDAIGRSAGQVAESQRESIRKGLATIVINLARRNQSLLDRQVEYLDALEQSEEDPERLAELFRIDHLSTRMRRNAESLLVLAGADPGRRKGSPVAISDVLRVAIGEIENYQHIELGTIDEGRLPAGVAVDLAHLTAELMENATQFSPPTAPVEVTTARDRDAEAYEITVTDRGMGLGDRLDQANQTLADPPELGLGMGRSLGFIVVGRLAKRLRATVSLDTNPGGGTVATVRLPLSQFQEELVEATTPRPTPTQTAPTAPAAAIRPPEPAGPPSSTNLEKLLGIQRDGLPPTPDRTDSAPAPDWQQTSPFESTPQPTGLLEPTPQPATPPPPPVETAPTGISPSPAPIPSAEAGGDWPPSITAPPAAAPQPDRAWDQPPAQPSASTPPPPPWTDVGADQRLAPFERPPVDPLAPTDPDERSPWEDRATETAPIPTDRAAPNGRSGPGDRPAPLEDAGPARAPDHAGTPTPIRRGGAVRRRLRERDRRAARTGADPGGAAARLRAADRHRPGPRWIAEAPARGLRRPDRRRAPGGRSFPNPRGGPRHALPVPRRSQWRPAVGRSRCPRRPGGHQPERPRPGGTMSEVNQLSAAANNVNWLVNNFVAQVPGVTDAVVVSSDGLPIASSEGLDRDSIDRFSAVASGLIGLSYGAAGRFGGGAVTEVIVEMEHAFLFVTGISDGSLLAVMASRAPTSAWWPTRWPSWSRRRAPP